MVGYLFWVIFTNKISKNSHYYCTGGKLLIHTFSLNSIPNSVWPNQRRTEEICRFYVSRQHLLSCGKGRKSAKIDISIRKTHHIERLIANNGRKVLGGRLRQGTQLHTQE